MGIFTAKKTDKPAAATAPAAVEEDDDEVLDKEARRRGITPAELRAELRAHQDRLAKGPIKEQLASWRAQEEAEKLWAALHQGQGTNNAATHRLDMLVPKVAVPFVIELLQLGLEILQSRGLIESVDNPGVKNLMGLLGLVTQENKIYAVLCELCARDQWAKEFGREALPAPPEALRRRVNAVCERAGWRGRV